VLATNTRVVTRDVGLRNWKQKQSGRLSRGITEKAKENSSRKPLNCKMVTSNATMVKGVQKALENINSVLGAKISGIDSRDEGKLTGCSLSGTGPITRPTLERTPSSAYP